MKLPLALSNTLCKHNPKNELVGLGARLVSPNLEDELASSVVLVFFFHDFSWD
jgi:hypothetical protein